MAQLGSGSSFPPPGKTNDDDTAAAAAKPPKDDGQKEIPEFNPDPNNDGSGGDSGSSGGSSGGTKTRKATARESAKAQHEQQLIAIYLGLWGTPPPPGYIERMASSGMNVFEFEAHERSKPSFKFSPRYQEERIAISLQLAQRFGALG